MNTLRCEPLHKKNDIVITMNIFTVQLIFLSLFSPALCATGPTSYGGIQITPSIISPVNQYSSIPVSVTAVLANGATDTSFTSSVSLAGAVGLESFQFQDDFEGTVSYGSLASGSTMSYDTTVYATASTRSAKITGASSTNLAGPYYSFGADVKPVRYSMYMRSNSTTKLGPIVSMVEEDFDYYTASNVLFDGSVGRIRMRRCSGSCTYIYSTGVPYVANQWYKIDVVINWSAHTVDLYVDDILRDSGFPLMYGSSTYTMHGIVYYNYDKGVTGWVDNVKVISAEGNPTAVSISPTTIPLTNGVWNGNVQVLSSTATNTYLRALSGFKEGRSNTFSSRAGCIPGQASATYYSNCVACAAGTYSTTNGASGCTSCNPGTYQQSLGQTGCTNCTANQFNPNYGSNSSLACQTCPFPQISYPGSASCSSCKPGEYSNGPVCMGCPNGTYGTGGPSCTPCPAGTYNSLTNQSICVPCPSGQVYAGTGATSASNCTACSVGQYAYNSSLCLGCDVGTYNDMPGQTSCTKCLAGTYNNLTAQSSSNACIPCPLGHHASLNGSTSCVPCDIGTYANVTGLATCPDCSPGSAANGTGTINCTICTEGLHALNYGQDLCQPCDPGTASNRTGEEVCPSCAPGYFSSSAGLTQCSKCVIGTFANETGTSICYNCPTNYTTATDGSDSGSDCILQCGDGRLQTGEFCDDHNHVNGDGCSTECTIEPGFICLTPGQPCINQTAGTTSVTTTGGDGDGHGGGGSSKTSTTAVAAAAVGAIALVVCLVGIIVGILLYRRREKRQNQPPSVEMPAKVVSDMDSNYRRIPSVVMAHSPIVRGTYDAGSGEKIPRLSYSNQIHYNELDTHDSTVVGKGAFGVVFSAYWHGQKVAVKEIKNENISEDDVKKFIEEAELMRNLKPHANVVLFLGVVLEPFCIVTEFLECGDLHSFLNSDSKIPMDLQLSIIKDIARGMFHLALEGIVHRDLAARNVLLTRDFAAKVSDFGLSRIADADNVIYSKSDIGPLKWMAPEAIRRKKYSEKSDVFAFGVTCFEILSREEPYRDMDAVQVATAVVGEGLRPEIPHWTPPRLAEIVAATWETDPDHRPTFHQLVTLLDTVDLTEAPLSN